jgi:uncharacterized protein DUF4055
MTQPYNPGIGISSATQVGPSAGAGELSTQHPSYTCKLADWVQMRDTWSGQRAVKSKTTTYLPYTDGMFVDGMEPGGRGARAYNAYLTRALYHSFVSAATDTMLGMIWNKPPVFEIPEEMQYLLAKATTEGEGLEELLRSINREQLITGRVGLLVDLPAKTGTDEPKPFIAVYHAEKIINWDAGFRGENSSESTNLVVLDECGPRRSGTFNWLNVQQFRVLQLGELEANEAKGVYKFGVFGSEEDGNNAPAFSEDGMVAATSRGVTFDHIPWTFVNANSTVSTPCDPPLMGLSDLSLAIYRLEADYRQALFMQTQDTLFTSGFNEDKDQPLRTGAGGRIHSPVKDGKAMFIGVTSTGLPELRTARENDLKMAASKSGDLMDASSRARESGSALEMRIGSKTSVLNAVAIAGAEGLQKALRDVGQWLGVKELDAIKVKPNFEFASREFAANDFKLLVESKLLGAPLSWASLHAWSSARGGPGKDMTWDQVVAQLEEESNDLNDMLSPKITPKEQADLDLQQSQLDIQEQAASDKAEADLIKAKQKPAPAAKPAAK